MANGTLSTDASDFGAFAGEYRAAVERDHAHIRTLGLPTKVKRERDAHARIPLRDIFVPLRFQLAGGGSGARELADVLAAGRSSVVLGDPGTGKSTLLAFLALLYAGGADLPGFTPPPDQVPLLISLRDFARAQQASPGFSFVDFLARHAASDLGLVAAEPSFFEAALRSGRAVVLIDGLDEVGRETARHRIARAVRALSAAYPLCRFWVTSRIYGYTRDVELPSAEFEELTIGRLDDDQVHQFIARWYEIQEPDNLRERTELAESLLGAVHRSASVRRLAGNPLLITLMAFLHQSLGRLPRERGELYELCIDMLLRTWRDARSGEGPRLDPHPFERLGLHVATQKDYLAHLAIYIQDRNDVVEGEDARGLVGEVEALDCLARRHLEKSRRARPGLEFAEAREEMEHFLTYLGDETGLLVNRGNDKLAFLHLSFQEYLAAWVFLGGAGGADAGFFIQHLGSPAWEEVLLLRLYIVLRAPGGGGEEAFDRIVRALLDHLGRIHFEPGWKTLARGVRDDLSFTPKDREAVLRKAVELWAREGRFEGEWFEVLEEIGSFAPQGSLALRDVLARMPQAPGGRAEASARLRLKLFGTADEQASVVEPPPVEPKQHPLGAEVIGTVNYHPLPHERIAAPIDLKAATERAPEVVRAARPGGQLDVTAAMVVLDDIEVAFGPAGEPRAAIVTTWLAMVLADVIWGAFSAGDWAEADMRAFADAVLDRASRSEPEERDLLLEATLGLLGAYAGRVPFVGLVSSPEEMERLVVGLPGTKLWIHLRRWAAMSPRRRGPHARAVRRACCAMDQEGTGSEIQFQSMLRGVGEIFREDPTVMMFGVEMQCVEILSALWINRPLMRVMVGLLSEKSQRNYKMNFEEMLGTGARLLAGQVSNFVGYEGAFSFPYSLAPDEVPMMVTAPPEALLLRAQPGVRSMIAPSLAFVLGRHDGRTHGLLERLTTSPEAEEVKDTYAHQAVLAPWRLFREDPAWIASWRWASATKGVFEMFPASLDDLRAMLSEPPGPLSAEADLVSIVFGRTEVGGPWSSRIDIPVLLDLACCVPGTLSWAFSVSHIDDEQDGYTAQIQGALQRLEHPHEVSAARMASDILFLRSGAARRPFVRVPEGEIDLRERLPGILVSILDALQGAPHEDTLAAVEAPILRLSARAVERLAGPEPLPDRDRLWLTYRLFQWVNLQLDRMPRDARVLGLQALRDIAPPPPKTSPPDLDLLDPARFDRARFDHRFAIVVFALGLMEDLVGFLPGDENEPSTVPASVSSPALEERLAKLASRPLTDEERSLRHHEQPSCLGWEGATTVPEAALCALLRLNEEAFFLIEPEARSRWLHELPRADEPQSHIGWTVANLVSSAATNNARRLSTAERAVFEHALRALDPAHADTPGLRWFGLTALHAAGVARLGPEVVRLLEENLTSEQDASWAFGTYLTGLSRLAPDTLVPEAERILGLVEAAGLDPIPFASALARPIVSGAPTSIRSIKAYLRRLAERDPYQSSEPMKQLLGMLGVT